MSFDDLKELVEAPLEDDVQCLDLDETVKISVGDREIRQHLLESYGITDSIKVQEMDKEKRNEIIISCLEIGAGMRQLSRLTCVTYGVIHRNPSKHRVEDHLMLNFIKHNRKLMNKGEMKPERIELFNELLALIEANKRLNQYQ